MNEPTIVKIDWISILLVVGALFIFRLCDRPEQPISFNTDDLDSLNASIKEIREDIKQQDSLIKESFKNLNKTYEKIDTASDDGLRDILHSLPRRHNHNISK